MEKAKSQLIVEIIEYVPDELVHKTVINKHSGTINAMSFDSALGLDIQVSAYNNFVQVVEGEVEVSIVGNITKLRSGQGIMIPADNPYFFNSDARFKLILTIVGNHADNKE